ncbi:MAG: hypothetical protein OXE05_03180 [Chloroflexi bacterium]|nr:hypothetical protein [Chloroflexota bacterium]
MSWPGITDFSEAVQNPRLCFKGTELEAGTVAVNQRGMPLVYSGSFACVYSVSVNGGAFAVRCFTREVKDQQTRYNQLSDYLINVLPPAFVHFEYLEDGINLKGHWYPIVKMEWVQGEVLSAFVDSKLKEPDTLRRVAAQWRGGTTASLRGLRIAHNDLQHGNVMVQADGNIRLVDYDGMFLPQFRGERSPELGHKNYQHPQRSAADYDDYVDNFPTLVVYLSLLAVAADSKLWSFYNDDNLIFTGNDYADPGSSAVFDRLKKSRDPAVVKLTERLEEYCALPDVKAVPDLETILQDIPPSTAPSSPATASATKSVPATKLTPSSAPRPSAASSRPAAPTATGPGYRQALQAQPPARTRPRPPARQASRPALAAQPAALLSPARASRMVASKSAAIQRAIAPAPASLARDALKVMLGVAATVLIVIVVLVVLSVWAVAQLGW